MKRHDAVGAGSGIVLGPVLVYALGLAGVVLPDTVAVAAGGALALGGRAISKHGLSGLARALWKGSG